MVVRDDSLTQYLLHGSAFGEFVNELVEVAYLLHERVGDVFDTVAAYHSNYHSYVGVELWSLCKEGLKVGAGVEDMAPKARRASTPRCS